MAEASLISEELRKMVGRDFFKPLIFDIEKGAVLKFAQTVEDPNPLWQDEEYAKKTKYGDIVAPPLFLVGFGLPEWQEAQLKLPLPGLNRVMAEGMDYEFLQPVRPGDKITVSAKLFEVSEKDTKLGKMVLFVGERTFTNQKGEVVAKERMGVSRY